MGKQICDTHSGCGGGDGEVGDCYYGYGILVMVVSLTEMLKVTVDVVVVMIRGGTNIFLSASRALKTNIFCHFLQVLTRF